MGTIHPNPTLGGLQKQLTTMYPGRKMSIYEGPGCDLSHKSNGSAHCDGRAVDIFPDDKAGATGDKIAEQATKTPGVSSVIWNKRIWSAKTGKWSPFVGVYKSGKRKGQPRNPHTTHVHVEIPRAARGSAAPAAKKSKKKRKKKVSRRRAAPRRRSMRKRRAAAQTRITVAAAEKKSGALIVQGEPTVVLGRAQLMAAHKETPHTGGGKIKEGSPTVFVGARQLAFARIGDPTTDKKNVVTGKETVFVG